MPVGEAVVAASAVLELPPESVHAGIIPMPVSQIGHVPDPAGKMTLIIGNAGQCFAEEEHHFRRILKRTGFFSAGSLAGAERRKLRNGSIVVAGRPVQPVRADGGSHIKLVRIDRAAEQLEISFAAFAEAHIARQKNIPDFAIVQQRLFIYISRYDKVILIIGGIHSGSAADLL